MSRPIIQLILIQLKEYFREPEIIFWSIIFPILIAWGLGIAFTQRGEITRHIALIENSDKSNYTLRTFLEDATTSEQNFNGTRRVYARRIENPELGMIRYQLISTSWKNALRLLQRGTVSIILKETADSLYYYFDPMNDEAQLVYLQFSAALKNPDVSDQSRDVVPLTETGTRYIDFLIPGLIAMGLMMSTMWGISYSLIEKRAKKLLRRLLATPMRRSSFLIAQFVARILLTTTEAIILYIFAHYYFDITITGNLIALALLFIAGVIAFTGISIFISSRTSKTEVGNWLINAVVLPMMIFSGIFFSYHNFPQAAIPFIRILPLTMLADGIRSIFIEGIGLTAHLVEIFSLSGIGVVFFLAGLKIYRWY